jgi:chemotaxis methyl-accepting protein methylase
MDIEYEKLGKEIQNSFSSLLKEHLPKNLLDKLKENKTVKIISIACGKFIEAECLLNYFSPYEKHLKLYGLEIDEELLNSAQSKLLTNDKKDHIFLKAGDASKYENYEEWIKDGLFDLIIVRHPEITFNTDVFMKIFSNFNKLLDNNGYLFITTHYENEKTALSYLLKILKLNILADVENKNPASLKKGEDLVFADRFLLIGSQ